MVVAFEGLPLAHASLFSDSSIPKASAASQGEPRWLSLHSHHQVGEGAVMRMSVLACARAEAARVIAARALPSIVNECGVE